MLYAKVKVLHGLENGIAIILFNAKRDYLKKKKAKKEKERTKSNGH